MPVIPDLTPTSGEWRPAAPSVSAAMAPGLAMSSIGDGIQDVGSVLGQIGDRVQKVRDDDAFTTANLAIMEADAEHQVFRAKNPDPGTWEQNRIEGLAKVREKTQDLPISTDARRQLDTFLDTTEAKSRFETKVSVAQYEVTKARQNTANLDLEYRRNGNFDAALALQHDAQKNGVYSPADAAANREDIQQEKATWQAKQADKALYNLIAQDPAHWLETHKETPKDMDPVRYRNAQKYAQETLHQVTVETVASVRDGITTGDIRSPQDIDHFASHLRPAVREQLKQDYLVMADQREDAFRRTPEYQNLTIGKISGMMGDYQQEAGDADVQYVKMDSLIRTLPDGPARSELESRIKSVREGKQFQIKTTTDAAMAEVDKIAQSGRFGNLRASGIRQQTTASAIEAGLLQDREKLALAGLDDAQSRSIATADRHALLNAGVDPSLAGTNEGRTALFKTYYSSSSSKSQADPYLASAFAAIHTGSPHFQSTDPELEKTAEKEREQALQTYGRVKANLAQWIQLNPKASLKETNDHLYQLSSSEIRSTAASQAIGSPPI